MGVLSQAYDEPQQSFFYCEHPKDHILQGFWVYFGVRHLTPMSLFVVYYFSMCASG